MRESISNQLAAELTDLEARGRRRDLPALTGLSHVEVDADGKQLISFSSNDYLALASHPALARAASQAAERSGSGSGASRLVAGNLPEHLALESCLASLLAVPAALLFPTGYQANIGVLTALAGPSDLIVADRAVHASIIDGCRLSRAKLAFYPHLQLDKAEHHLTRLGPKARRRYLVTESLFSMDGDVAPLPQLAALATTHDAALIVDEAHAIGATGPRGAGLCARFSVLPDVIIGTLGKAFGSAGAFVAGSSLLRDYLVNRARTLIFTTAPPPPVAAAALEAAGIISSPEGDDLRARLAANLANFRSQMGLPPDPFSSPIVPIVLGSDTAAVHASDYLRSQGFFVQPIRPPTVREGTARIRLAFSAAHSAHHISRLADALSTLPGRPPSQVNVPRIHEAQALPVHSSLSPGTRRPNLPVAISSESKTIPAPRGAFLAGTDTGVGKTSVATAILHLLATRGFRPVPFKPVETGANPEPHDAVALLAAAHRPDLPISVVCPIPLRQPVAPAAAAISESVDTSLPVLRRHFAHAASQGDVIIVESAGGLMSPYSAGIAGADLVAAFGLPLLLVARNSLGTVNHAVLAIAEIRRRSLPFLGLILVDVAAQPYPHDLSNARLIADLTGVTPLGTLPFLANPTPTLLADAMQESVDLRTLWNVLAI